MSHWNKAEPFFPFSGLSLFPIASQYTRCFDTVLSTILLVIYFPLARKTWNVEEIGLHNVLQGTSG